MLQLITILIIFFLASNVLSKQFRATSGSTTPDPIWSLALQPAFMHLDKMQYLRLSLSRRFPALQPSPRAWRWTDQPLYVVLAGGYLYFWTNLSCPSHSQPGVTAQSRHYHWCRIGFFCDERGVNGRRLTSVLVVLALHSKPYWRQPQAYSHSRFMLHPSRSLYICHDPLCPCCARMIRPRHQGIACCLDTLCLNRGIAKPLLHHLNIPTLSNRRNIPFPIASMRPS